MTEWVKAYVGARIHDGESLHEDHALTVRADGTAHITPRDQVSGATVTLNGGVIAPGFVDLQVNGGGGIMFNDDQSVTALRQIAAAHASIGTAALLPTLITDTAAHAARAIDAVEGAIAAEVPGIIGIHLEGPHLSVARKGAHDPGLIRRMTDADLDLVLQAAKRLPNVMITVAPESTTNAQIAQMAQAGVVVSLGHTDADFETCMAAFDAGARCATHLFNAMSQITGRAPGLVGAALLHPDAFAGLIADGIHVHPAAIRLALAAKTRPEQVFLVTDAMASAGSDIAGFELNGRYINRQDGRLTLQDGTLAGADLEMAQALGVMTGPIGEDIATTLARATGTPARLLRDARGFGRIGTSPLIYLSDRLAQPEWLPLG